MNRSTRTLVVVLVALVAAGAAAYGVFRAIQRIPVREVAIAERHAVVAARALPVGARLQAADVRVVAWPASNPIPGGFDDVAQVIERGLLSAVVENEPLSESKLAPLEAGAGLTPTIPSGMRAIAVRVNDVIGVAGFAVPGTRVDVLVTIGRRDDSTARTVVSDVQVLASGTKYDQQAAKDGEPIRSAVATLLVTPDEAERIALAANEGSIALALRNPLDRAPTATPGVRMASLLAAAAAPPRRAPSGPRRPAAAATAPVPAAPGPYTVETIRAAKRTEETVK